jgi:DNA-binding NtrC family response regulator
MPHLVAIDDKSAVPGHYRAGFANSGSAVETAVTVASGSAHTSQWLPDVILFDIDLPDLSGLETHKRICEIDARDPLIFVAANGTTDTAVQAIHLGPKITSSSRSISTIVRKWSAGQGCTQLTHQSLCAIRT